MREGDCSQSSPGCGNGGRKGEGAPEDECRCPRRLQTARDPPSLPGVTPALPLPSGWDRGLCGLRILVTLGKGIPPSPADTPSQALIRAELLGPREAADEGLFVSRLVTSPEPSSLRVWKGVFDGELGVLDPEEGCAAGFGKVCVGGAGRASTAPAASGVV